MKKSLLIIAVLAAALALSACSGVIGGDTSVVFSVSDGRHVSTNAVEGFVMAMKEDKVYSLNQFEGEAYQALEDGKAVIANLPVGEYIFGVALMDSTDDNVGFAVKKYEVKRGLNDLVIEVAPGIDSCTIGGFPSIENFLDPPDWIDTIAFSHDTVTIDYGRGSTGPTVDFVVDFGDGTGITSEGHTIIGGASDGNSFTSGNAIPADADGVRFNYSGAGQEYTYRLILK